MPLPHLVVGWAGLYGKPGLPSSFSILQLLYPPLEFEQVLREPGVYSQFLRHAVSCQGLSLFPADVRITVLLSLGVFVIHGHTPFFLPTKHPTLPGPPPCAPRRWPPHRKRALAILCDDMFRPDGRSPPGRRRYGADPTPGWRSTPSGNQRASSEPARDPSPILGHRRGVLPVNQIALRSTGKPDT